MLSPVRRQSQEVSKIHLQHHPTFFSWATYTYGNLSPPHIIYIKLLLLLLLLLHIYINNIFFVSYTFGTFDIELTVVVWDRMQM